MGSSDYWSAEVDPVYGCWIWSGRIDRDGYGKTPDGMLAHRHVYQSAGRRLEPNQELDHACRRRACVNPTHLEPVSRSANLKRISWRRRATQERCRAGHDLYQHGMRTPEGGSVCRACNQEQG